jgi:DNA-binding MarR family transcriptional regulator
VLLNIKPVDTDSRERATEDLLNELTSWSPRERMGALRKWHQGSLSLIQLHVLTTLEADGPLTMGRLAEAMDVSVASATGIVNRMEKRGLVERRHGETDRRVVVVRATESGTGVFREMEQRRRTGLGRLLGSLTDDELNGFLAGLMALRAARTAAIAADEHHAAEGAQVPVGAAPVPGPTPGSEPVAAAVPAPVSAPVQPPVPATVAPAR